MKRGPRMIRAELCRTPMGRDRVERRIGVERVVRISPNEASMLAVGDDDQQLRKLRHRHQFPLRPARRGANLGLMRKAVIDLSQTVPAVLMVEAGVHAGQMLQ